MNNLDERIREGLRDIVAAAPEPPDFDALTGTRPDHRPRRALVATAALLVGLAVALTVTLLAHKSRVTTPLTVGTIPATVTPSATATPTTAPGPGPAGFVAPLGPVQDSSASTGRGGEGVDGVVVHLVVDADGVTSGETIAGHLQVINNTDHALEGGEACRPDIVAPVIYGGHYPERPVFTTRSCATPFAFPVGVTTLPFRLSASFESPSGSQPLPTGYYHVGVVVRGPHIPVPQPLTVIVLPSSP